MKPLFHLCLFPLALFLFGCSGSDVYRGNWKATDPEGNKFDIVFEPENISIKDSSGKARNAGYKQYQVKIENSVRTYGIQFSDGRNYNIFFPIAGDVSKGLITTEYGEPMYIISRNAYIQYDDIYNMVE